MFEVPTTPAGVREEVAAWCEDAAEWRLHKAAEFPGRGGSLAAFYALEAAADELVRLPGNDPGLRRLAAAWSTVGPDIRALAISEQRRALRNFGGGGDASAASLLAMLADVVGALLDVRGALAPAGDAVSRLPRSA